MQNRIMMMFVMLLIGVVGCKAKVIKEEARTPLNDILLFLISPFVIFSSYQTDLDERLLLNLAISFGLAAVSFTIEITVSYLLIRKKDNMTFATERMNAIYSNCGFIGIPLIYSLFDKEGVFYLTAYLSCFNILLWTQGVILMTGRQDRRTMVKNLCSPTLIATAVGLLCFLFQIRLPEAVKLIPLIATACPAGASGTMFALRYHQDSDYASHIFAVTTMFSIFTMPLIVIMAQKIYI